MSAPYFPATIVGKKLVVNESSLGMKVINRYDYSQHTFKIPIEFVKYKFDEGTVGNCENYKQELEDMEDLFHTDTQTVTIEVVQDINRSLLTAIIAQYASVHGFGLPLESVKFCRFNGQLVLIMAFSKAEVTLEQNYTKMAEEECAKVLKTFHDHGLIHFSVSKYSFRFTNGKWYISNLYYAFPVCHKPTFDELIYYDMAGLNAVYTGAKVGKMKRMNTSLWFQYGIRALISFLRWRADGIHPMLVLFDKAYVKDFLFQIVAYGVKEHTNIAYELMTASCIPYYLIYDEQNQIFAAEVNPFSAFSQRKATLVEQHFAETKLSYTKNAEGEFEGHEGLQYIDAAECEPFVSFERKGSEVKITKVTEVQVPGSLKLNEFSTMLRTLNPERFAMDFSAYKKSNIKTGNWEKSEKTFRSFTSLKNLDIVKEFDTDEDGKIPGEDDVSRFLSLNKAARMDLELVFTLFNFGESLFAPDPDFISDKEICKKDVFQGTTAITSISLLQLLSGGQFQPALNFTFLSSKPKFDTSSRKMFKSLLLRSLKSSHIEGIVLKNYQKTRATVVLLGTGSHATKVVYLMLNEKEYVRIFVDTGNMARSDEFLQETRNQFEDLAQVEHAFEKLKKVTMRDDYCVDSIQVGGSCAKHSLAMVLFILLNQKELIDEYQRNESILKRWCILLANIAKSNPEEYKMQIEDSFSDIFSSLGVIGQKQVNKVNEKYKHLNQVSAAKKVLLGLHLKHEKFEKDDIVQVNSAMKSMRNYFKYLEKHVDWRQS